MWSRAHLATLGYTMHTQHNVSCAVVAWNALSISVTSCCPTRDRRAVLPDYFCLPRILSSTTWVRFLYFCLYTCATWLTNSFWSFFCCSKKSHFVLLCSAVAALLSSVQFCSLYKHVSHFAVISSVLWLTESAVCRHKDHRVSKNTLHFVCYYYCFE